MKKAILCLAVLFVAVGVASAATEASIKFTYVPEGTTITYVDAEGESITEDVVVGKAYPASSVVTFGAKGTIRVIVLGSGVLTSIRGDVGAKFSMAGSSPVGGPVVIVPEGGANVFIKIGEGNWLPVAQGGSSALGGSGPPNRQEASERQIDDPPPIPLTPPPPRRNSPPPPGPGPNPPPEPEPPPEY